jgi:hypothetical protein
MISALVGSPAAPAGAFDGTGNEAMRSNDCADAPDTAVVARSTDRVSGLNIGGPFGVRSAVP